MLIFGWGCTGTPLAVPCIVKTNKLDFIAGNHSVSSAQVPNSSGQTGVGMVSSISPVQERTSPMSMATLISPSVR